MPVQHSLLAGLDITRGEGLRYVYGLDAISVLEVLDSEADGSSSYEFTLHPAYALKTEDLVGRIAEGFILRRV